jgi:hypothetical protein
VSPVARHVAETVRRHFAKRQYERELRSIDVIVAAAA